MATITGLTAERMLALTGKALDSYESALDLSAPLTKTILSGTVLPKVTDPVLKFNTNVGVEDGGVGRVNFGLMHSQVANHPLNLEFVGAGGTIQMPAGTTYEALGGVSSWPGSLASEFRFTGAIIDQPLRWEIAVSITGFLNQLKTNNGTAFTDVACSKNLSIGAPIKDVPGGAANFDKIAAAVNGTHVYVWRLQHQQPGVRDALIGTIALPGASQTRYVGVSLDGRYVAVSSVTDNKISIYDVATMTQVGADINTGVTITRLICGYSHAYAANNIGSVSIITLATATATAGVSTPEGIKDMVLVPIAGVDSILYVLSNDADVRAYSGSTGGATVPPAGPWDIADEGIAIGACEKTGNVFVLAKVTAEANPRVTRIFSANPADKQTGPQLALVNPVRLTAFHDGLAVAIVEDRTPDNNVKIINVSNADSDINDLGQQANYPNPAYAVGGVSPNARAVAITESGDILVTGAGVDRLGMYYGVRARLRRLGIDPDFWGEYAQSRWEGAVVL